MKILSTGISYSKAAIGLIVIIWLAVFFKTRNWERNHIADDVINYYGYLPAFYIYGDPALRFIDKDPAFFGDKYWPEAAPNGGRVIKTSMGLSYLYTPFFFIGHGAAALSGYPQDGFSLPYIVSLLFSCIFYLTIGFIFLRKLLLKYFSDSITAIVLLCLFFGTNLYWYSWREALFSHAYSFSLLCVLLYLIPQWHERTTWRNSLSLGFLFGLLSLIRPTLILLLLVPFLYGMYNKASGIEKIQQVRKNYLKLLAAGLLFILPQIPQLIYWKINTGSWIFYSYTDEKFFFGNPHIPEGLFSYRKGWLLYTPVMIFSVAGFFFRKKFPPAFYPALLFPFILSVYVTLSWWCWWYGGSFGNRAFIDYYSLLSIPLAAFFTYMSERPRIAQLLLGALICMFISLNLFQNWQYYKGLIHYDGMTRKSYWIGFLQRDYSPGWWESIRSPNIEMAMQGKPADLPFSSKEEKYIGGEIAFNGFEKIKDIYEGEYITDKISRSGKQSFRFHSGKEFYCVMETPAEEFPEGEQIQAEVAYYPLYEADQSPVTLVVSFEENGKSYAYHGQPADRQKAQRDEWNKIEIRVPLRELKSRKDIVKVYLWNQAKKELYIDDFKVRILHRDAAATTPAVQP